MPVSYSQPNSDQLNSAKQGFTFAELLNQESYITNLNQFLAEADDDKALRYWLGEFVPQHALTSTRSIEHAIARAIAEIDELISDQINLIIHHPKFQKLEASWRGLWYLAEQAEGTLNIKVKILDISWAEVVKDIGRSLEFDQSQLFHKIYSEEYGTPGGEPYGVIIGDYEISHRMSETHPHDDIATLEGIAQIAAASFSPFIASASSDLFGMDNFSGLGLPLKLQNIFVQTEYIRWRALREKPDSRFIGLTLPKILMRRPYLTRPGSYKGLYFHEQSTEASNKNFLWGNACYAFAGVLIREFSNIGWFGHIRGVPRNYLSGGLVSTLIVDAFETDADQIAVKPITDVIITDAAEKELSELGFIPLCQCYCSTYGAFYNNQSIQQPKEHSVGEVRVNLKLSSMLQHILCASRIAHYVKIIIRDKVGSFMSADDCEKLLTDWLFNYTTGREDMEWEEQARYPLREAKVQVKEHPMKPGEFICSIHLKPHYQLDHMVSELELITELASAS
jgi:type VI secretion system protein ImpD